MVSVSCAIIAYNEELNLEELLKNIKNQKLVNKVSELFLISDGSTDNTNNIIKNFKFDNSKRVRKIIGEKRIGKYYRINQFIKKSKGEILILCNADVIPEKKFLEKIKKYFENEKIQVVTTKGIPVNPEKGIVNKTVHIYWELHHRISLIQAKGTGLMAFRKKDLVLPPTSVDEVYLISFYRKYGKIKYAPKIKYYTKGPEKIDEFISQIRRYHNGHKIIEKEGHTDITLKTRVCMHVLFEYITKNYNKILYIFLLFLIELTGRFFGNIDFILKKEIFLWKIAKTTKDLNQKTI